jgi:hypothetical protein
MSLIGSNLPLQILGTFDAQTLSLVLDEHFCDPGSTHRGVSMDVKITIPSYVAMSLPLSWVATTALKLTYGSEFSAWKFGIVKFTWTVTAIRWSWRVL